MRVLDIRLLNCNFKINRSFEENGEIEIGANINFNSSYNEEIKIITGILTATVPEAHNLPYNFLIEVGGKFELEDGEDERVHILCTVNVPSIIFPYLREIIADITRRSGNQPMHLSTMNFAAMAKDALKEMR